MVLNEAPAAPVVATARSPVRLARWREQLIWLGVPALALLAWWPVLRLWFVADDFGALGFHEILPFPQPFLTFGPGNLFYRPLSMSLTWLLGYSLFGTQAWAYHAVSLVLHALAAFLLARAAETITRDVRIGWVAGALFAVYPLSTEPLAWLASQWDVWAAACALGAVWGFAAAWQSGRRAPYVAGLLATLAGVFMKESVLPLPLILPVVAFAADFSAPEETGRLTAMESRAWIAWLRRAALWTLPYLGPALLFVGLRLASGGGIGGYPTAATNYQDFFWDALVAASLLLIMPLNRSVFPLPLTQAGGLLMTAGLGLGLIFVGRRRWPGLLLAAAWFGLFLVPVLNLVAGSAEAAGNRVLYFSLIGFCLALAILLVNLLDSARLRQPGGVLIGGLLIVLVPLAWGQLQPWVQASAQAQTIVADLGRLVVPVPGRQVRLNVQNLPRVYKGAYVFWNGFAEALRRFDGQDIAFTSVARLDPATLGQPLSGGGGIYNLAFGFDRRAELYRVTDLSGITAAIPAPPAEGGTGWDYTRCAAAGPTWTAEQATLTCGPQGDPSPAGGRGYAVFTPATADGRLAQPNLHLDLAGAWGVRLAVCARLPAKEPGQLGEWFWGTPTAPGWSQDHSQAFRLDSSGLWRVYWTYLPLDRSGPQIAGLRFDPVNARLPVDIAWIAATPIR